MTLYSLVLFLHIAAVLTLFAALTFEALSLFHLRRASTLAEARLWMEPVPRLPLVTVSSALVAFLSGAYLAMRMSAFALAWPKTSVAALLLITPFGALTGRRMLAIRKACSDAKTMNSELRDRLRDPFLKTSLGVRIAIFFGIVLLMTAKPDLWQSIAIVGASVVLGFLLSFLGSHRDVSLRATGSNLRD
jgi:hypothetical protein